MRILVVAPALSKLGRGNRRTAVRWGRVLTDLGHEVVFDSAYRGQECDLLIALHAIRSADSVRVFKEAHPDRPAIVGLAGTDIYGFGTMFDEDGRNLARTTMETADRLVAFQPLAAEQVPGPARDKVTVIHQSQQAPAELTEPRADLFEVCVVGELREVKDPFLTALAARRLPTESTVRVLHAGAASSELFAERAAKEEQTNSRYNWLGEVSHDEALDLIARCRLLSITSRHEGGPNALTEALALGTPVVASRIAGTVGILGDDYPGYFEVEDAEALSELLRRAESDEDFYGSLEIHCAGRAELASPAREREAWQQLLAEL